jgi:gluconokinase
MLSYDKAPAAFHGPVHPYSSSSSGLQRILRKVSQPDRHVFVVYGPAGCGKTTIAQYVSQTFNLKYIEGDNVSGS